MCVGRSRRERRCKRCAANGLRLEKESDSEDGARCGRTHWLDTGGAGTCGRLVAVRTNRAGVDVSRRRGGYRRGFRLPRLGDKRRCSDGLVAADSGGDLRTRRRSTRCVVASHRTVVIRGRGAGAPQFTRKRPDRSPGQNRCDQQCRCAKHCPAPQRGKCSAITNTGQSWEICDVGRVSAQSAKDFP